MEASVEVLDVKEGPRNGFFVLYVRVLACSLLVLYHGHTDMFSIHSTTVYVSYVFNRGAKRWQKETKGKKSETVLT